jgi:ornithine carbamoyltransferase
MGHEEETESRRHAFLGYAVDEALMAQARPEAIFLHCLPAHRGEEVSEAVLEGPRSRVWAEAENRLHIQKALMAALMSGNTRSEEPGRATTTRHAPSSHS